MIAINNQKKGIVVLEINNPPVNALSLSLVKELNQILGLRVIEDAKLVVFKGIGKGFCAGADLKERSRMTDNETIKTINRYRDLFKKIENLTCITIARIHGFALGGGLEFSLSCDFRFSTKESTIGLPETSIGIIPGAGGTQRLTRLIGFSKSKKWIFTAQTVKAEKAFEDSIIDRVFDNATDMDNYISEFAMTISENCKIAISSAKRAIDAFDGSDLGYDIERKEYLKTLDSDLRKESLKKYKK